MLNILFIARKNCHFSQKIFLFLKKKFKKVNLLQSDSNNNKELKKKILKIKKNQFDYLICFRSYLILDSKTLSKIKFASINFHPGPPSYRGVGCANFALINNEKKYGSTCHIIDEKVDNGKILDVKYFELKKKDDINTLLKKTHKLMYRQCISMLKKILINKVPLDKLNKLNKKYKWGKILHKRKKLNQLYNFNKSISKKKLKKLLAACVTDKFSPYVTIHGEKFIYSK